MKKLILTSQNKTALRILGLLLLANLLLISLAHNYFSKVPEQSNIKSGTEQTSMVDKGWQTLNWGFSLLEYFKKEATQN
ncbi:MAG: hypothetical protein GC181_04090 [Bacteroidetes bacterium]|nr:hypothetical protein [Bacteroidota bacterium]